MWHKSTANRGANDVASCLHRFLKALLNSVKHVAIYSGNCSGQNKNKISAGIFTTDVHDELSLKMVDHKFLTVGLTHMECDSDHATIERSMKQYDGVIETPDDWYNLTRYAGKSEIFDIHKILVNCKKDTDGNIFSWNEVRWLRYTKKFGEIMYKNSLSEEEPFKKIPFLRKFEPGIVPTIDGVPKTYTSPIGISRERKKDLESFTSSESRE
ncbi:hypothetical protein QAD02_012049 [Eretmocerus hayati]|uniref:Uncharacterized protein n=1 Tax=Eretmocerus hayati TaxID=131215 RepID=A0ACC2NZF7_9HYME|nr:hypothetical protein QAD02_012049 [Eretmocerus hayati]